MSRMSIFGAAIAVGVTATAAEMPKYPGYRNDYGQVSATTRILDGDPKKLAAYQEAGLAAQISQERGIPISDVMTNDGVSNKNAAAASDSMRRLRADQASAQNTPKLGMTPHFNPDGMS